MIKTVPGAPADALAQSVQAPPVQPVVSLRTISKSFAGVKALSEVSLDIWPGEVVCLAGENGSGKSTLIKSLSGIQTIDQGTILFNGEILSSPSPIEAVRAGIQVIYQDFSLLGNLTVAECIAFNEQLASGKWMMNWTRVRNTARKALHNVGVDIPLDAICETLPVASKQLVAIARALVSDARLIVMDEPTSALTEREVKNLLAIITRLKSSGIAVLFVSHKLVEVFSVCERVVVLRNGKQVAQGPVEEFDQASLTFHMTGRHLSKEPFMDPASVRQGTLLSVNKLTQGDAFQNISFELAPGEVLGIVGLLGSGRTELAKALFGIVPADSGTIAIGGKKVSLNSIAEAMANGIGYVPEDRLSEGLFLPQSIGRNIAASSLERLATRLGLIHQNDLMSEADLWIERMDIATPSSNLPVDSLSGGNQQRVMLARWLATSPKILVLNGPTIGVDVGSKADIHQSIAALAREGLGIILISDDLPEVLASCHRIMVMREGKIIQELANGDAGENELSHILAAGSKGSD